MDEAGALTSSGVLPGILDRADRDPEHPAVKDPIRDLSYHELREEAERVAHGLARRGVAEGDRVAIYLPNSADFVVTALASLWVGAIFVPLPITDPDARLSVMLDDCEPALIVVPTDGPDQVPSLSRFHCATVADLATDEETSPRVPSPGSGAYSIYTSGTTGTPKGVLIGNDAFAVAIANTVAALGLDSRTRSLCVSPIHFDGSFLTVFPTLFAGGAVVMQPRDTLIHPRKLFNMVEAESITYTGFSPTYLRMLLASPQFSKLAGTALRIIALGGEAASLADVETVWRAAPELEVWNRYGPTETAIAVTHIKLTPELTANGSVPIGRPHPGVAFYLVDEGGDVIEAAGAVGELYIGGAQLMSGYWRAPELTAEVLRGDVVAGARVYRTGDLMYRDDSDNYVYVARADRVVKRSGMRISLIEMGEAMRKLPGVASVACVSFDAGDQLGIAAFVVPEGEVTSIELRRACREWMADTMLPDRVELVDELPLTASSKLDERRLLADAGLAEYRPAHPSGGADGSSSPRQEESRVGGS
jgi:amino acid adenylation domain-containing protein